MDQESHYSKAPITEAILDIQVETAEGLTPLSLAACQDSVLADYPTKRELKATIAQFEMVPQLVASATSQDLGFAFISPDGKQLFQTRMNGFTVNRLAPYVRWETFSQEARRLWNIYREAAKPARITRIALRYINRIDIPTGPVELKDYFNTTPEVARGLPQSMAGFFMQVLLPLEDVKAFVNIVETIVEPPQPGIVSVVLDLDFFRTAELPGNEEELWNLFEVLRVKKNAVFDTCITEKTKELIR
jgi:uncharacterized protein (TIGR04255 family)